MMGGVTRERSRKGVLVGEKPFPLPCFATPLCVTRIFCIKVNGEKCKKFFEA
jgi:hypothetical protein